MQGYRYPRIPAYLCTLHDCIQLRDCIHKCNSSFPGMICACYHGIALYRLFSLAIAFFGNCHIAILSLQILPTIALFALVVLCLIVKLHLLPLVLVIAYNAFIPIVGNCKYQLLYSIDYCFSWLSINSLMIGYKVSFSAL